MSLETEAGVTERVQERLAEVRCRVDTVLAELFDSSAREAEELGGHITGGLTRLRSLALAKGKRIRPAFTQWGFVAAGGDIDDERAIRAGATFELLHVFALIHDDVMDEAATRRSMPTLHTVYARRHESLGLRGSPRRYGENMAILLGDFALILCTRLAGSLPPPALREFYRVATQLMHGQYLDLETSASGQATDTLSATTALLKTASYTVQGPLLVGAALAGRDTELRPYLDTYGRSIGTAFQYRDDLLDVLGETTETGKPVGTDVLQHKATRLLDIARRRATGADRALLTLDPAGNPGLDLVRDALVRSGAVAEIGHLIDGLVADAITAIDQAPVTGLGRTMLFDAAQFISKRKW